MDKREKNEEASIGWLIITGVSTLPAMAVIPYILFSIIQMQFNPLEWTVGARILATVVVAYEITSVVKQCHKKYHETRNHE